MASNARSRIESQQRHIPSQHVLPLPCSFPPQLPGSEPNRGTGEGGWTGCTAQGKRTGERVRGEEVRRRSRTHQQPTTTRETAHHLQHTTTHQRRSNGQPRRGCCGSTGNWPRAGWLGGRGCALPLCVCPLTVVCSCCHRYWRSVRFIRVDIAADGNRSVAKEGATAAAAATAAPTDACTQLGGHGTRTSQSFFTHPGVRKRFLPVAAAALLSLAGY
jgi:hypothetical protein